MRAAVVPLDVKATMAAASRAAARSAAAAATACGAVSSSPGWEASMMERYILCRSVLSMMRLIIATASLGYWPVADSADSMTASAPSYIAVATSDASARVGVGADTIESS